MAKAQPRRWPDCCTSEVFGSLFFQFLPLLEDGVLTLKGEKRSETEDKERQFSERFYGRFERRIPLGYEVEEDGAT
ncbi:HSP20 family protein [Mesorhizobium tianshanense]|uniref:HSP20 family protein n=1 Tax=Mesorhizobium tianshanense TaxID=39844 RepID=A0A562NR93_9HYPH|nr:HSP20 family protein [Mesorhizobium tianshanense]